MKYPYNARSASDPNGDKGGLGFPTEDAANAHAEIMNRSVEQYPEGGWNTDFWKMKPEPWIVVKS